MDFFISDLHFGHANCLKFDNRPFASIEEQDREIIKRWNQKVKPNDHVWILGDISWYGIDKTVEIFNQLNGIKHLCIGNHDSTLLKSRKIRDLFVEIVDYKELRFNRIGLVLCHYPISCYKNHYNGWFHFYGHVHTSKEAPLMEEVQKKIRNELGMECHMYNVGCMMDYIDYVPHSFEEIIQAVEN